MVKYLTDRNCDLRCGAWMGENMTDDGQYQGAGFFCEESFSGASCYYRVKFSLLSACFFGPHASLAMEQPYSICSGMAIC